MAINQNVISMLHGRPVPWKEWLRMAYNYSFFHYYSFVIINIYKYIYLYKYIAIEEGMQEIQNIPRHMCHIYASKKRIIRSIIRVSSRKKYYMCDWDCLLANLPSCTLRSNLNLFKRFGWVPGSFLISLLICSPICLNKSFLFYVIVNIP